jgi:hypothetical protein
MIKIAFIAPWWNNPNEAREELAIQTPAESGEWGQIKAVDKIEEADFFVIWQRDTKVSDKLPEEKKIYIQREPKVIGSNDHLQSKNNAFFVGTYDNAYQYVKWWVDKTYDELTQQSYPQKNKSLNTILSYKRSTYGHRARIDFMTNFLLRYPEDIDVYGTFNSIYPYLRKAKDSKFWNVVNNFILDFIPKKINRSDKFDLTLDYKYSFVAENCQQENYFTEKIVDAYLSWSMPIYWGCPNIADYFPEKSYCTIDISSDNAVERMHEIIQQPVTKENVDAMREARELILNHYNVWPAVENIVKK